MDHNSENPTFAQRNKSTGLIEIIDCVTGKILSVQRDPKNFLAGDLAEKHTLADGTEVLIEKGLNIRLVEGTPYKYSPLMADLICQKVAEGSSLKKVSETPGFPSYNILMRWQREVPEFKESLEIARRDRAEYMRDLALEEADIAESSKDPINAHSLRVETYKWAAAMDDQRRYSPRAKIEDTQAQPVNIIINTGIYREEINEPRTVQTAHSGQISSNESATTLESGKKLPQTNAKVSLLPKPEDK